VIFLLSGLQIITKVSAVALLAVTNGAWLWYYIAGDYALHFAYRAARQDLLLYFAVPPAAAYPVSALLLAIFKTLTDFTGCINFRNCSDLGGQYWLFSLIATQVSMMVSIHLYDSHAPSENKLDIANLWTGAAALSMAWLLVFAFFAVRIAVPNYRHTLWSAVKGKQVVIEYFTEGKDDEAKMDIFGCQRLIWEGTIGKDVKKWTFANWEAWNRDQPEWFSHTRVASVPDEYIPPRFLGGLGGANRQRRGSAAGSVRESFRVSLREEEEGVEGGEGGD
jgi:hypothetical protein